jgi:hypothetical protein
MRKNATRKIATGRNRTYLTDKGYNLHRRETEN